MGWVEGFEPSTAGATVRSSTTELHPPYPKIITSSSRPLCGGVRQAYADFAALRQVEGFSYLSSRPSCSSWPVHNLPTPLARCSSC